MPRYQKSKLVILSMVLSANCDGLGYPVMGWQGALAARRFHRAMVRLYPVFLRHPRHFRELYPPRCSVNGLSRHKAARVVPAGPTRFLFHDLLTDHLFRRVPASRARMTKEYGVRVRSSPPDGNNKTPGGNPRIRGLFKQPKGRKRVRRL